MSRARAFPLFLAAALFGCARRPIVVLKPTADFSKIERVAVLGFDDFPRQRGSGALVSSIFEKRLLAAGYSVVERRRVDDLLSEQKLSVSGAVDPKLARKLGRVLGVDALILGSVTDFQKAVHEHYTVPVSDVRKEPIIKRVVRRKKVDDQWVETEEDQIIGHNTIRTTREETHTRTIQPVVGVAVRMVDVDTGEVLWVGSTSHTALATDEAAEDVATDILDSVKHTWPIMRGKKK
ncbi:MAG: hypothetical protein HY553_05595 [Elusimicrobia bacterium]|nr:hypothetical protein [Elusimicrobiota bacterium]